MDGRVLDAILAALLGVALLCMGAAVIIGLGWAL